MSLRRVAVKAAFAALLFSLVATSTRARAAQPQVKVEELEKALIEDANYKVRVQAALVLGRLGDHSAVPSLVKALSDGNKTVRAIVELHEGHVWIEDVPEGGCAFVFELKWVRRGPRAKRPGDRLERA